MCVVCTYASLCVCYCVVYCSEFYVWSLLLTFSQLRSLACCVFFSSSSHSSSLFRSFVSSIWKTCTYYDICFRFFGEQEGRQLRIVVQTVQTCKLFALRRKYKRKIRLKKFGYAIKHTQYNNQS